MGYKVDDTWQVEIYEGKDTLSDYISTTGKLISVSQYKGSKMVLKDIDTPHLLPPSKKGEFLKKSGAIPGYLKLKLPKDMTIAQYRSMVQAEQEDFDIETYTFEQFWIDEKKYGTN